MPNNTHVDIPTFIQNEELLPKYSSLDASGADVRANIKEPIILKPRCSVLIPTGIRFSIPKGYEMQIRPRSGLALKHQVTVLNTPGTIDADYRGEVCIIMINHGKNDFIIKPGMRVAQLILASVCQANFVLCDTLDKTQRGSGGFGHTGTH